MSITLTVALVTIFLVSLVAVGVAVDYVVSVLVTKNVEINLAPPELPSDTEYEIAMALALRPFLSHLKSVDYRVPENDKVLLAKIDTALNDLMSMRLRTKNSAHIATVLVLEKWRRAIKGSAADQANVAEVTEQLLRDYPWLGGIDLGNSSDAQSVGEH